MISIINFRGYKGDDPLDHVSTKNMLVVQMLVTAVATIIKMHYTAEVWHIVDIPWTWVKVLEVVSYAGIIAPTVVMLRKSSSIVHFLVYLIPLYLLDLYLEANFRSRGIETLWQYPDHQLTSGLTDLKPLLFFVTLSFDAILIGPICLWLSRLIATLLPKVEAEESSDAERLAEKMPAEWREETPAKPARDAGYWILRILGIAYGAYLMLLVVGAAGFSPWPDAIQNLFKMTYANPYFGVSTFSKIGLMLILAFIGAYNINVRWHATRILCLAHVVSVAGALLFYFERAHAEFIQTFLLTSAILDGAMVVAFIWIMFKSKSARLESPEEKEMPDLYSIPAMLIRRALYGVAAVSGMIILVILMIRIGGFPLWLGAYFGSPDPTLANTLAMHSAIVLMALGVAKREKLREYFVPVIAFGYALTIVASLVWCVGSPVNVNVEANLVNAGGDKILWYLPMTAFFVVNLVVISGLCAALLAVRKLFYAVDYNISSFNPSSARSVMAIYDAVFGADPDIRGEVLQSVDKYASAIRGRKRGILNFPFWLIENALNVVFGLRPSFSLMSRDEQRYFLGKYLLRQRTEQLRSFMPELAKFAHDISVAAHSILMFAAYSNLKKQSSIGYVPPGARDRLQNGRVTAPPCEGAAQLADALHGASRAMTKLGATPIPPRVYTALGETCMPEEVDYVVIGSGPGGAVMARRLADPLDFSSLCGPTLQGPGGAVMARRLTGSDPSPSVLLVERGSRYSLDDFNTRENEMVPKLYKEGGLQQTKRSNMFVLQGECVGGGSIVYNAVCYKMHEKTKAEWSERFGISLDALDAEYCRTGKEVDVQPLGSAGINTKVRSRFERGVNALNCVAEKTLDLKVVNVNARSVIGDGLWNIGNRYLAKRTMAETYIPKAEAAGAHVVSNTTAVRFVTSGRRAVAVVVRTNLGELRTVKVKKGVLVAGGVIASSHFLMRSGVRGNVGRQMSCNFSMPIAFEFERDMNAFDGEQITMGAMDPDNRALFETYFNPPGAFSLTVPFFFRRHCETMDKYARLLNFGVLIGSEPNGRIEEKADILNGRAFTWRLGERDEERIKYALTTLLEMGKAAGAFNAIVPTKPGLQIPLNGSGNANLATFRKALYAHNLTMDDLLLSTAHPMGGNIMVGDDAAEPEKRLRVVDEKFRVVGYDNVFVCDASIFPTSLTVNPAWTIMAMSSLASQHVLECTQ
jgi:choline dehydrogenase-like flavoprotein